MENRVYPMVNMVILNHMLLPNVIHSPSDVDIGPSSSLSVVILASIAYSASAGTITPLGNITTFRGEPCNLMPKKKHRQLVNIV